MKHLKYFKIYENEKKDITSQISEYFQEFIDDDNLLIKKEFNKYYLYFKIPINEVKSELCILDNIINSSSFFEDIKTSLLRLKESGLKIDITVNEYSYFHKIEDGSTLHERNHNFVIEIIDNSSNQYVSISKSKYDIISKEIQDLDKKDIELIFNAIKSIGIEDLKIKFLVLNSREKDVLINDEILDTNITINKLFISLHIKISSIYRFQISKLKNNKFLYNDTESGSYYLLESNQLDNFIINEVKESYNFFKKNYT